MSEITDVVLLTEFKKIRGYFEKKLFKKGWKVLQSLILPENVSLKSFINHEHSILMIFAVDQYSTLFDLIQLGGEINFIEPRYDMSPLHRAVDHNQTHSIELLLQKGANPNILSGKKNTPLHTAITNRYTDQKSKNSLSKLLLKYGANPKIKNSSGKTPIDLVKPRSDLWQLFTERLYQERLQQLILCAHYFDENSLFFNIGTDMIKTILYHAGLLYGGKPEINAYATTKVFFFLTRGKKDQNRVHRLQEK